MNLLKEICKQIKVEAELSVVEQAIEIHQVAVAKFTHNIHILVAILIIREVECPEFQVIKVQRLEYHQMMSLLY